MGLESKFWNKLGFILILAHFPATWELKIWKFSNFGQNHFSDFETPFLAGLMDQYNGFENDSQKWPNSLKLLRETAKTSKKDI